MKQIKVDAVIPKRSQEERKPRDKTPSFLPPQFSAVSIVSPRRCGKTNLIVWMLFKGGMLKAYKRAAIFTPSALTDPVWSALESNKKVWFSDVVSDSKLKQVMELQQELARQSSKNTLLLVLDDFGSVIRASSKKNGEGFQKTLDTLYSRARHIYTTIICTSQFYSHFSPCARLNTTHFIAFRLAKQEWEKVYVDFGLHLTKEEFVKMMQGFTKDKYEFAMIDLNTSDDGKVFHQGFVE